MHSWNWSTDFSLLGPPPVGQVSLPFLPQHPHPTPVLHSAPASSPWNINPPNQPFDLKPAASPTAHRETPHPEASPSPWRHLHLNSAQTQGAPSPNCPRTGPLFPGLRALTLAPPPGKPSLPPSPSSEPHTDARSPQSPPNRSTSQRSLPLQDVAADPYWMRYSIPPCTTVQLYWTCLCIIKIFHMFYNLSAHWHGNPLGGRDLYTSPCPPWRPMQNPVRLALHKYLIVYA